MADPKVYTRAGDTGQTSMLSGDRVSKASPEIAAVGDLDELSVSLGFARLANPERADLLQDIQQKLYQISAAVSYTGERHADRFRLEDGATESLEKLIDDIQDTLPPLKDFIYPGQTHASCTLHQARVVARRVERGLSLLTETKRAASIPYINRLSDLLFVLAREADKKFGADEQAYKTTK